MDPTLYCREKVAPAGSDLYYSTRALPAVQQDQLLAAYALQHEIEAIPRTCSDPGVAMTKLQWWLEELNRTLQKNPQHPVTQALEPLLTSSPLPPEALPELVKATGEVLNPSPCVTFAELEARCQRLTRSTSLLVCAINGSTDAATPDAIVKLGGVMKIAEQICSLGEGSTPAVLVIPAEDFSYHRVDPVIFKQQPNDPQVQALIIQQVERAITALSKTIGRVPKVDRARQASVIIQAELLLAQLEEVKADHYRVLTHKTTLTPMRKLWISWRVKRREEKLG